MATPAERIRRLNDNRFLFLAMLYEMCGSDEGKAFPPSAISLELKLDDNMKDLIVQWLVGEGFVKLSAFQVSDGSPPSGPLIHITHKGVVSVEAALLNPNKETAYFPPVFGITTPSIQIQSMTNSQVQVNSPNSIQQMTISDTKIGELKEIVLQLKKTLEEATLSGDQKATLESSITAIESQATHKPAILKLSMGLSSANNILQSIRGAYSNAADIVQKINNWVDSIT